MHVRTILMSCLLAGALAESSPLPPLPPLPIDALARTVWVEEFDISPDGELIAFKSAKAGTSDIWTVPTSGGAPTQLTRMPGREMNPHFSPDGSQIVFEADFGGTNIRDLSMDLGKEGARAGGASAAAVFQQRAAPRRDGAGSGNRLERSVFAQRTGGGHVVDAGVYPRTAHGVLLGSSDSGTTIEGWSARDRPEFRLFTAGPALLHRARLPSRGRLPVARVHVRAIGWGGRRYQRERPGDHLRLRLRDRRGRSCGDDLDGDLGGASNLLDSGAGGGADFKCGALGRWDPHDRGLGWGSDLARALEYPRRASPAGTGRRCASPHECLQPSVDARSRGRNRSVLRRSRTLASQGL